MISMPPVQNQENLPTNEQLKNIRAYLFQLAQELQTKLQMIDKILDERK